MKAFYWQVIYNFFVLVEKDIMCLDIFSQNILDAKTGNYIYCFFSMTSCTICKNYYEAEFFGKLLEKKESFFFTVISSHWRCSVRKVVLGHFAKSTEKHLGQALGLQLYWKGVSHTGVFLWIFYISGNTFFYRTPPDNCFCYLIFNNIRKHMIDKHWIMDGIISQMKITS